VTAQFSEPVTGFTADDVSTTNAAVSNFLAVDGDTYTFTITAAVDGLVTVDVGLGAATDFAGNPNTASNTLSWTFDGTAPSVTLTGGGSGTTSTQTYGVTAQFSENVTGFDSSDLSLTNATASNFIAVDGDTYTFDVSAAGQGLVSVQVPADIAQNGASALNL